MNVASWLDRAGAARGDLAAIATGAGVVLDYRELTRRVASLAGGLRSTYGLDAGDRVAIVAKNHRAYLEVMFASWWAGLTVVPINAKLHPSEVDWIAADCGASALFASADLESSLLSGSSQKPERMVTFDSAEYERLMASEPRRLTHRKPDDIAWLFYTSGTTGRPKGAMLSHRNLAAMSLAHLAEVDPTAPGDALLHCAPLSHGSGLYALPHVCAVGVNVIPESGAFDPIEVAELLRTWKRTSFFAAPTMVRRLVKADCDLNTSALRTIVFGGAPMHVVDTIEAVDRLGPRLAQIYGQGESPMTITALSRQDIADRAHPRWRDRLATAGTPRAPVEVRIAPDGDDDCPPGASGEILVRGDSVMAGYWGKPDATSTALRDGWLHTGDVGAVDTHGYLTLLDRSKDVIISGGSNIYPREVEEVLLTHSEVAEVAVIGRPDPDWGEVVVAYVVGRAEPDELDGVCLDRIARFKRPRSYEFVDVLPKNNYGKVLKTELREVDERRAEMAEKGTKR